ncbi:hypothetical protein ACFE04_021083 [Oxalis oulophora]
MSETKEWTDKYVLTFLQILYERVKNNPNNSPSFKDADWKKIDNEMKMQFTELINNTGVTWDVDANKKNKGFKTFRLNGCKNYELLAHIFSPSTATQKNKEKSAKIDEALDMLASPLSSREQLTKAKLEKMETKKNKKDMMEGKISAFEEQQYTIDEAMNLLNDMPHLSAMQYTIAVERTNQFNWRKKFLQMVPTRRLDYLQSLELQELT